MNEDKKKSKTVLYVRDRILASARERLRKFSLFSMDESKKKLDRWERKAEKERRQVIKAKEDEIYKWFKEQEAKVLKGYELREEQRLQELKPPSTPPVDAPKQFERVGGDRWQRKTTEKPSEIKRTNPGYVGNWMASDATGNLWELPEVEDGDFRALGNRRKRYDPFGY